MKAPKHVELYHFPKLIPPVQNHGSVYVLRGHRIALLRFVRLRLDPALALV
jgi:hypothetical protein